MKHILENLDKAFESRVRLGIMALLSVNDSVEFNELKEQLDLTDGNLASHVSALEKLNYLQVFKEFVGKKPRTTYQITEKGKKAFSLHVEALGKLLS